MQFISLLNDQKLRAIFPFKQSRSTASELIPDTNYMGFNLLLINIVDVP